MLNFRNILPKRIALFLILIGLACAIGLIINNGPEQFVVPTAIGETHKEFIESDDFQYLDRANRAFINLVKHTTPSVVQINTKVDRPVGIEQFQFFGETLPNEQQPSMPPSMEVTGIGSGVIVSDDGYILTNNHVIQNAKEIIVTLHNGKKHTAELIGSDPGGAEVIGTDLAVLKIDEKELPALPFGDSEALEVGEWVIAIGTPFNLSQTVTRGVVSAKNRYSSNINNLNVRNFIHANFIQTDAPINKGNSGGALINIRGELVGINTLIATNGFNAGNVGIGFAIPSNIARDLLPQLIENGKIVKGWLGIRMSAVDDNMAEKLELDETHGVIVNEVGRNSPAEKAGIQHGDVILEFNEKTIKNIPHLMQAVAFAGVGTKVKVKLLRKGKEVLVTVKLDKRTEEALASFESSVYPITSEVTLSGMHVQNLTPELANRFGHKDETGVIIVEVEPRSIAARNGISPGYLIKEIDYTEIATLDDFETIVKELKESKEKLALVYFKDLRQRGVFVTLKIDSDDR